MGRWADAPAEQRRTAVLPIRPSVHLPIRAAMRRSFWNYLTAAFNARPFGMFVAPNWIGLAAVGVLGLVNPGFWLIGAGVEFAYLFALATSARFQRVVDARDTASSDKDAIAKQDQLLRRLSDADQARYVAFAAKCQAILEYHNQPGGFTEALDVQRQSLAKLTWMYVRLLLARRAMSRVLKDAPGEDTGDAIEARITDLKQRLAAPGMADELVRSLKGQVEILEQRLSQRSEGREKLSYLDAEMSRLQEQLELLKEQAALSTQTTSLSDRIDEITATLGGTTQWIKDQQQLLGGMDDLLEPPPPLPARSRAREAQ